MVDRESILPIGLGMVFAIVLHLAVVPLCAKVLVPSPVPSTPEEQLSLRPDLLVTRIRAPMEVQGSEPFEVSIEVTNQGLAAAEGKWRDSIYLSRDTILDSRDALLAKLMRTEPLDIAKRYQAIAPQCTAPPTYQGHVYLLAVADSDNTVQEDPREDNNVLAVPVEVVRDPVKLKIKQQGEGLPTTPDLVVRSIEAPKVVFGDKPFELGYVAANIGGGATSAGGWTDGIYLSKDDVLDPDDPLLSALKQSRPLRSTESYRDVASRVMIPEGYSGDMYVIVKADAENEIDESPNENNNTKAAAIRILSKKDREEVKLGKDDETPRLTIAWISHEDFIKMQAPKYKVIQPAVQTQADPVANAPIEYDPTPPQPTSPDEPQEAMRKAQLPAESRKGDPAVKVRAKSPQRETAQVVKESKPKISPQKMAREMVLQPPLKGELPANPKPMIAAPTEPTQVEVKTPEPDPSGKQADQQPGEAKAQAKAKESARTGEQQRDQPPRPPTQKSRPTIVPRMQAQAPLFDKDEALKIRPGKVLTGNGIEIKTVLPNIGIVARSMIYPARNPQVVIRFSREGKVIKATIVQSSGNTSWDTPIVASIYKWRATGENLRKRNRPFEIEVTILIDR